ncbi:MAG: hydantoinase/oxoprolinase family protein, partial [Actinobacteria bacterium]|nr:hydantoinase/oxoprolinase family protein [Actinomycetota bacterium]
MSYVVGTDVGGTFSDLVLVDERGELRHFKAPTTPSDPAVGVLDALAVAADAVGQSVEDLLWQTSIFANGTTVGTNAIIEQRGARVGLLTTRGFEDTLLIMRALSRVAGIPASEVSSYAKRVRPTPIVPRTLTEGVTERVDYRGRVVVPLDRDDARRAIERLGAAVVDAVAISLLWSFANPEHEQLLGELVRELLPEASVTLSSDLIPVIGEYERTATTALNAFVRPVVSSYLEGLQHLLANRRFASRPRIMQCTGGVAAVAEVIDRPIYTLDSGPVGGIAASAFLAAELGHRNVVNTDMGGTSFDVGLIVEGEMLVAAPSFVGRHHVSIPKVEIVSIGSGGGSIARCDFDRLRVGPSSAGADPGPACYGRGGIEPTVTDADLILGYLNPDYFLAGRMRLDAGLAREAIRIRVAEPLGLDVVEAAVAIYDIVNAQAADLIRKVTVDRGHDPRDFALFAYGGAGPTHCAAYGRDLGVSMILIPRLAATHSALGAAVSDYRQAFSSSRHVPLPADPRVVGATFKRLEEEARGALRREGIADDELRLSRAVEMRYGLQVHEIMVPVPPGPLGETELAAVGEEFERRYELLYGRGAAFRAAGMEIVTFRVFASGSTPKPDLQRDISTGSGQPVP